MGMGQQVGFPAAPGLSKLFTPKQLTQYSRSVR
jgi:hypothetical protein